MEGVLEMEDRRLQEQLELERRQNRRNTLQLISAVAQWIALLACLVYIAVGFLHHPTPPRSEWISVTAEDYVAKEKRVNISWKSGTMQVRNLSIPIICDGFYLVSLKGTINKESQKNTSLTLEVCIRHNEPILSVQVTEDEMMVDLVTVSDMRFKDEVYLKANRDASYKGLKLSLVLVITSSYCSEVKENM